MRPRLDPAPDRRAIPAAAVSAVHPRPAEGTRRPRRGPAGVLLGQPPARAHRLERRSAAGCQRASRDAGPPPTVARSIGRGAEDPPPQVRSARPGGWVGGRRERALPRIHPSIAGASDLPRSARPGKGPRFRPGAVEPQMVAARPPQDAQLSRDPLGQIARGIGGAIYAEFRAEHRPAPTRRRHLHGSREHRWLRPNPRAAGGPGFGGSGARSARRQPGLCRGRGRNRAPARDSDRTAGRGPAPPVGRGHRSGVPPPDRAGHQGRGDGGRSAA